MRAVLVTSADAANRDGEHEHPRTAAMVEGSLYSEGRVRRTIGALMRDGWIELTGHPATVARCPPSSRTSACTRTIRTNRKPRMTRGYRLETTAKTRLSDDMSCLKLKLLGTPSL